MAAFFFGAGFSSESESESLELSFLAAAFFFGAGLASEESESESLEDSFLAAFLAGAAFLTGLASEELSESEELSFLAAFFAGAAFLTGLASDDELSESEEDSFLAGAFLAGFLMTCTDSDEESESLLDSTFFFFCTATFWASLVLATFLELSLLTLDAALDLFSMTFFGGSEESESLSESDEDSTFLTGFFFSFFSASFLDLFLVSSILCFLDGASDELADTFFYNLEKIS